MWGILLLLVVCAGWFFYAVPKLWVQFSKSQELIEEATRYSSTTPQRAPWVLVVGDSTGVGVGTANAQESVAGRLANDIAQAHGGVNLVNLSLNGATFKEVAEQLEDETAKYDVILILAGGNDVLRFKGISTIQSNVFATFAEASRLSDNVFVLPAGNLGNAPVWPSPLQHYYRFASARLHEMISRESIVYDVQYVNVFRERNVDPFALEPNRYFSRDGLHPSGEGYGIWYNTLHAKISSRMPELFEKE